MFLAILHHYLIWHYAQGFVQFLSVWKNLLWFIIRFFSLPELIRSWVSPWKRITEQRTKAWDIEDFFGSIIINILSRIIGFIMRTMVIAIGLVMLLLMLVGGAIAYLAWIVAPALVVFLIILGVSYIV
jgi:hypothetical protein